MDTPTTNTATTPAPRTEVWMVTDLSQPDPASGVHEPEFGPFADKAEAESFAQMRESYWAHDVNRQGR